MYYKVLKNNRVIDVLDYEKLVFLKWYPKHQIMITCPESEAQAILSSNGKYIWHTPTLLRLPNQCKYDTVILEEVDKYEYEKLKALNCRTPEEIIDAYTLSLLEGVI